MKLYVCYGTIGGRHHACARAHDALRDAGHEFEVEKTYGCFRTDRFWPGRREVKDLTGNYKVPTLVLDDGTVVDESQAIVDWASANPAGAA
jgi:glutathione S-transferase